jgi:hypothetical protein
MQEHNSFFLDSKFESLWALSSFAMRLKKVEHSFQIKVKWNKRKMSEGGETLTGCTRGGWEGYSEEKQSEKKEREGEMKGTEN